MVDPQVDGGDLVTRRTPSSRPLDQPGAPSPQRVGCLQEGPTVGEGGGEFVGARRPAPWSSASRDHVASEMASSTGRAARAAPDVGVGEHAQGGGQFGDRRPVIGHGASSSAASGPFAAYVRRRARSVADSISMTSKTTPKPSDRSGRREGLQGLVAGTARHRGVGGDEDEGNRRDATRGARPPCPVPSTACRPVAGPPACVVNAPETSKYHVWPVSSTPEKLTSMPLPARTSAVRSAESAVVEEVPGQLPCLVPVPLRPGQRGRWHRSGSSAGRTPTAARRRR